MNEDEFTIATGHLDVGDGHQIYYQTWGDKYGQPVFHLHGGPGGATSDAKKLLFDPSKHYVVFHDQRGSGKSKPFAEPENNTTQKLVEDIEKLRQHLKISSKVQLAGGSWGSTLALAYAIEYPDNVDRMLMWGIYTGTKAETDYIMQGGLATHFPDSWEEYIKKVPSSKRNDTVKYYYEMMSKNGNDDYIRSWQLNEGTALRFDTNIDSIRQKLQTLEENDKSVALLEAHYFIHNCFMEDNYIFNNADKLSDIDIVMVQGRYDHVCPPATAFKLAKKLGKKSRLQIVPGAHHSDELVMREVIKAYAWSFLD